jgi:hypothetical protein
VIVKFVTTLIIVLGCKLIVFVQIAAITRGLLQVVPQAVLDLLTWQELEKRVCGDPEISLESLRRSSKPFPLLGECWFDC